MIKEAEKDTIGLHKKIRFKKAGLPKPEMILLKT